MASNFPFAIVELDEPYIYAGNPLTHAVISDITVDVSPQNPGSPKGCWTTVCYGVLTNNALVLTRGSAQRLAVASNTEWAQIVDAVTVQGETAGQAVIRAGTLWLLDKGHLEGSII